VSFAERAFYCRLVTHIARRGFRLSPSSANARYRRIQLLLFAAGEYDSGPMFGKAFRHTLADTTSASCYESGSALEKIRAKDAHGRAA